MAALIEMDPGDDAQYLEALSAYADELYTALGNMACLLKLRAGTGRGPDLVDLHIRSLSLKDQLIFAMRSIAPDIEARLRGHELVPECAEYASASHLRRGVADLDALRQWRALNRSTLTAPQASAPPAIVGTGVGTWKGGDAS